MKKHRVFSVPPNRDKRGGPYVGSRVMKRDGEQPEVEFVGRSVRPVVSKDSAASKAEVEDVPPQVHKAYRMLRGLF